MTTDDGGGGDANPTSPLRNLPQLRRLPAEELDRLREALQQLLAAGISSVDDVDALAAACAGKDGAAADGDAAAASGRSPLISRLPQDGLERMREALATLARAGNTKVPDCASLLSALSPDGDSAAAPLPPAAVPDEAAAGGAKTAPEADCELHDDPEKMFDGEYRIADCAICARLIVEDGFEVHWANGVQPEGCTPCPGVRKRSSTAPDLAADPERRNSQANRKRAETVPKPSGPAPNKSGGVIDTTSLQKGEDDVGNKTINEYAVLSELGRGAYGKVKLVVHNPTNTYFAIKIMNKSVLSKIKKQSVQGATALDDAMNEIAIMKRLEHANVVKLHEVINDPECNKLYLILDYVEKGPIFKIPEEGKRAVPLDTEKIRKFLCHICQGLDYLHFHNIIHRDIKPDNILVSSDGIAKLTDFGVSHSDKNAGDEVDDTEGTPAFLTPEQLQQIKLPAKMADIWALGVTLYCMTFAQLPFTGGDFKALSASIMACNISYTYAESVDDPDPCDPQLLALMKRLLDKDFAQRMGHEGIRELMRDEFLSGQPGAELQDHAKIELTDEDKEKAVLTGNNIKLKFGNAVGVMMQTKAAVRGFMAKLGGKQVKAPFGKPGMVGVTGATPDSTAVMPEVTPPPMDFAIAITGDAGDGAKGGGSKKQSPTHLAGGKTNLETASLDLDAAGRDVEDVEGEGSSSSSEEESPKNNNLGADTGATPGKGGGSFRLGAGGAGAGGGHRGSFCPPKLVSKRSFRTEEEVIMEEAKAGDVVALIKSTQEKKFSELTLNCYKFEEMPPELFELTEISRLTSHLNGLKKISGAIANLQNMRYLNLGQNELKKLPREIGSLKSLTHLDLNRNKLLSVPDSLGDLPLRTINLDYNDLDEIPECLGRIKDLEKCYLVQNEAISLFPNAIVGWAECQLAVTNTPVLNGQWAMKSLRFPAVTVLWDKVYPDQVTEHVFLGSLRTTQTEKVFRKLNITNIVTAGKGLQVINPLPKGVEQMALNVDDSPEQTLVPFFDRCTAHISALAKEDKRVLVHCFAGLSRSVTIVCAYLMKTRRMTFKDAISLVKRARPAVNPNEGFRRQLIEYEFQLWGTRLDPEDVENVPNGPGVDPEQFMDMDRGRP